MLIFVVLSSALTLVLGFNASSFLVAVLEIRVDVVSHVNDHVFAVAHTLNLVGVHFSLVRLS